MGNHWSTEDIPNLVRKIAIVTGANSGIGYHTALELGRKGATVILACRNARRGHDAVAQMKKAVPDGKYIFMLLDVTSHDSILQFVAEFKATFSRLDLLIHNAGFISRAPRLVASSGFDLTLATNYLGPFALTGLLMDWLQKASAPRVVMVSAVAAHRARKMAVVNLHHVEHMSGLDAFAESKLAGLLFIQTLARKYADVVAVGAHPGISRTPLLSVSGHYRTPILSQPAEKGAHSVLCAATSLYVRPGDYVGPRGREMYGFPVRVNLPPIALDVDYGEEYWQAAAAATGVCF